ncbi:MAG: baseplate J/gp47 family protein [Alphaproteobacteria bacterium]
MTIFTAIDLSKLPAPDLVEALDYEAILAELTASFLTQCPAYDGNMLESDPIMKLLQMAAYREITLRARINDAAKQTMLTYSKGSNLDHLGALMNVKRSMPNAGDMDAIPPVEPTYETDDDLRRRIQLAPEALTTAGSEGAYIFHALSVAGVKDVSAIRTNPGEVTVTLLSYEESGAPNEEMINKARKILNASNVRPLTDLVIVQAASIKTYRIDATLTLYNGPDQELVKKEAAARFWDYVETRHRLGEKITRSGIHAALTVAGVQMVILKDWQDILCTKFEAPYCNNLSMEIK